MKQIVYIGTYTDFPGLKTGSDGIYVYEMDEKAGALTLLQVEGSAVNPSFLVFSKDKSKLFAANERFDNSAFSSYGIGKDGRLSLIDMHEIKGIAMCHLTLSENERWIFGANYWDGSIAWTSVGNDGVFGSKAFTQTYRDGSANPQRQESAHVHEVMFEPNGQLLVIDLGADKIRRYCLNEENGSLTPAPVHPEVAVAPGEGPRHIIFHPNKKWAYLINELKNSVLVFDYEAGTGKLTLKQRVSLLPEEAEPGAAEIQITQDGRFVFASTRFHDGIVRYSVDESGCLSNRSQFDCHGKEPRMFSFTENETHVLIANQGSNNVTMCAFDKAEGIIGEKCFQIDISAPCFVQAVLIHGK